MTYVQQGTMLRPSLAQSNVSADQGGLGKGQNHASAWYEATGPKKFIKYKCVFKL